MSLDLITTDILGPFTAPWAMSQLGYACTRPHIYRSTVLTFKAMAQELYCTLCLELSLASKDPYISPNLVYGILRIHIVVDISCGECFLAWILTSIL